MSDALKQEIEQLKFQNNILNTNVHACKQLLSEQSETMTVVRTNYLLLQQANNELQKRALAAEALNAAYKEKVSGLEVKVEDLNAVIEALERPVVVGDDVIESGETEEPVEEPTEETEAAA